MAIKIIKKSGQVIETKPVAEVKKACKDCKHWQREVHNKKFPTMHPCPRHKCLTPPDSMCLFFAVA